MFLNNKYTRLYLKLTSVNDNDNDTYIEHHHIIPKCLGGTDDTTNIAVISARKHFLCHYLLLKMVPNNTTYFYKLLNAFIMMNTCSPDTQKRYINSRLYAYQRTVFSKIQSIKQTGANNTNFGKMWVYCPLTMQSKIISGADLQTYLDKGCMKGRITNINSFLQKFKQKEKKCKKLYHCKRCGTLTPNLSYCSVICANKYSTPPNTKGYKHLEDDKKVMSQKAKDRKKIKCTYCDTWQPINTINRYHNENCTNKKRT